MGNLTDDGKDYLYVYDAFGRLRFIKKRSDSAVVEEFTYNGLNHRVGWHYDADASGTVDGSDPWYYFAYDMDWRQVGVYRGADTSPKELFVHHMAGPNGAGGASAVDAVILRERDANSGWTSAADGVLEERLYFCQVPGTRGDVVALLSSSGQQRGQMRYSAYGVPFGMPAGDLDADGDCDFTDLNTIAGWISTSTYDVRADLDLDGDVDATDQSLLSSLSYGVTLGRGKLAPGPTSSAGGAGVRRGYAGYEHDGVVFTIAHVRNRALLTDLGRWTRRDRLGYVDGMSLYEYARSIPIALLDPFGLSALCQQYPCLCHGFKGSCGGGGGGGEDPGGPAGMGAGGPNGAGGTTPSIGPGAPPPRGVVSREQCEAAVTEHADAAQELHRLIAGTSCPPIQVRCCSGGSCGRGVRGYIPAPPTHVCICYDNLNSVSDVRTGMLHELVHALDNCNGIPNGVAPCEYVVCTEARAYAYSGSCNDGGVDRLPNETREQCILRNARSSARESCQGSELEDAIARVGLHCAEAPIAPFPLPLLPR